MTEIEAAFSRFKGKRALVMGLGLWQGGVEAVKFLHRWGASEILVTDLRNEKTLAPSLEAIKHIPVTLRLGEHREADFARAQVVIHSPAVRPDNKFLEAARLAGAEVTQEMSLFIEACPAKTVGITGSNGKTTTTLLCYEMLCEAYQRAQPELESKWADPVANPPKTGKRVWLGGNVGTPLINRLEEISKDDVVVLELSSFQLMDWHRIKKSCDVALITNITANHLDWHRDFDEYVWAKSAIYRYSSTHWAMFNSQNLVTVQLGREREKAGGMVWLFEVNEHRLDYSYSESQDHPKWQRLVTWYGDVLSIGNWGGGPSFRERVSPSIVRIPGQFNQSNAVAAMAAAFGAVGHPHIQIYPAVVPTLLRFRGVEHRLEPCGNINGARVYNDSIATDPAATLAALSAFDKGVHLILGGGSKNIDYAELGKRIATHGGIKAIYLQGTTAPAIKAAIGAASVPLHDCATFDEACERAFKALTPGDVLLMSPASTSFYEYAPGKKFANFEERGKHFKSLVNRQING